MKETFGLLAFVTGMVIVFVGLGAQINKLRKEKSSKGLSIISVILVNFGFIFWTAYGIADNNNYFIYLPNIFGFLFNSVVLFFAIKYRRS